MSAVLSEADRSLAAGFAGAVTMDEPARPDASHINSARVSISVIDYHPGKDEAAVLIRAHYGSADSPTTIGVSLDLPPSKALELATALFQSATRLIAAQDDAERGAQS